MIKLLAVLISFLCAVPSYAGRMKDLQLEAIEMIEAEFAVFSDVVIDIKPAILAAGKGDDITVTSVVHAVMEGRDDIVVFTCVVSFYKDKSLDRYQAYNVSCK